MKLKYLFIASLVVLQGCALPATKGRQALAELMSTEIVNKPVQELLIGAKPNSDGSGVYQIHLLPPNYVRWYDDHLPTPYTNLCNPPHRRNLAALVVKRPLPYQTNVNQIDIIFGYDFRRRTSSGCELENDSLARLDYLGMHHGNVTRTFNLLFSQNHPQSEVEFTKQLAASGLPIKSVREQCNLKRLEAEFRGTRWWQCTFDDGRSLNQNGEDIANLELGHDPGGESGGLVYLALNGMLISPEDESLTLAEIYANKMKDPEYLDRIKQKHRGLPDTLTYKQKLRYESDQNREQLWRKINARKESEGDSWLAKALVVGVGTGFIAGSDIASANKAELVEAFAKDVINDTGGANMQSLVGSEKARRTLSQPSEDNKRDVVAATAPKKPAAQANESGLCRASMWGAYRTIYWDGSSLQCADGTTPTFDNLTFWMGQYCQQNQPKRDPNKISRCAGSAMDAARSAAKATMPPEAWPKWGL